MEAVKLLDPNSYRLKGALLRAERNLERAIDDLVIASKFGDVTEIAYGLRDFLNKVREGRAKTVH
jgi:hypothetical protein